MLRMLALISTILLPMVSNVPAPEPTNTPTPEPTVIVTPEPNDEIDRYAQDISAVWENYRLAAGALTQLASDVVREPHYIRTPEFTDDVQTISLGLLIVREQLDDTPSPAPVEDLHREFERAADQFTLAGYKLYRFGDTHDLDDLVDALDLIGYGTLIWRDAADELAVLTGTTVASGAPALP